MAHPPVPNNGRELQAPPPGAMSAACQLSIKPLSAVNARSLQPARAPELMAVSVRFMSQTPAMPQRNAEPSTVNAHATGLPAVGFAAEVDRTVSTAAILLPMRQVLGCVPA